MEVIVVVEAVTDKVGISLASLILPVAELEVEGSKYESEDQGQCWRTHKLEDCFDLAFLHGRKLAFHSRPDAEEPFVRSEVHLVASQIVVSRHYDR